MEKKNTSTKKDKDVAAHFIKTFTDTTREPFLVLDPDLRIVGASASFYKNFQVTKVATENKLIYDLGNGQWDIPELKKLLENILPSKGVFNDYEVSHEFPKIGLKLMLLNARRLDETRQILLAIEDITLERAIEMKLANYTTDLEKGIASQTKELEARINDLEKLNKTMVGRELKMIELKKENTELKKMKARRAR